MQFFIFLCSVYLCNGYKILVVFPVPDKNHAVLGDSLVNVLLDANHEVTYVTSYPKEKKKNLTYIDISSVLDQYLGQGIIEENIPDDSSSPRFLPLVGTKFAQDALKHPDVQELVLNTTLLFDAVLVEWFYTGLLAPLAAVFECPLIWYTATDVSWQNLNLVSSTPAHRLDLPPRSLVDRLHQMWSQSYLNVWNYLYVSRVELPAYEKGFKDAFKMRRRALPNYESVVNDGSLLFVNSHQYLSPKVSLPPNLKYIGGHHLNEEVVSLPKNLKTVMNSSEAGVVYVNVEFALNNKNIREYITLELKKILGKLEQTVIWKYENTLMDLPNNVYTIKKAPQQGILNHPNTIAYINLGDMVSVTEAAYYGIPVIAVPITEDQDANVNLIEERSSGIKIRKDDLYQGIIRAMKTILYDDSYQKNAKIAKSILRHRMVSPKQEFLHWVEAVAKSHGAHYMRSPSLQLSSLEQYNVDIILLAVMITWFFSKVLKLVRVHLDSSNDDHEKED